MAEERVDYGDEGFIYLMALQQEKPAHVNDIRNGYIIIDDEEIPFKKNGILDGRMTITMPEVFNVMSTESAEQKYGAEDRPDTIYTFDNNDVSFTLTYKEGLLTEDEDIPDVKDVTQRMIARSLTDSKIIESKVLEANGRTYAYFDFAGDIYSLIFFFSLDGCLIMGSFECLRSCMNDWRPVLLQMLASIEEC